MTLTARQALREDIRVWCKAAASSTALTDDQVIPANSDRPRPAPPFLTVRVLTDDLPVGSDETVSYVEAGVLKTRQRGLRTGTVSVQGFGESAADWLQRLAGTLHLPAVLALLTARNLSLRPLGGIVDVTALLDNAREPRFSRDFAFSYLWRSDPVTVLAAASVETTDDSELVQSSTDPDPLSFTLAVDLEP